MLFNRPAFYTDFYELTMAQGYFLSGRKDERASFDYFFRKLPFNGGYVVFAGLADVLDHLQAYRFHNDELEFLKMMNFSNDFINFLKDLRISADIHAVAEGELIFPNEPVLRVSGSLIEAQLVETLVLNLLNFESLIATKAARIKQVAGSRVVLDFGLRRAQGFGGLQMSRACVIGGLDGTSNVYAAMDHGLQVSGTMAHSWIQSFENEITAFRTYAQHHPEACVLLVDTYNTLGSGIPNAIRVAKELEGRGHRLLAVRLDSGDLAYLAKKSRAMLDQSGLDYVKIAVSNQLDEYLIKSLIDQDAPIDIFGVGTRLAAAYDHPALDGVYKLCTINGRATLKMSENVEKITLPGKKRILRYLNEDDTFYADAVLQEKEQHCEQIFHPHFPHKSSPVGSAAAISLLNPVMINGKLVDDVPDVNQSAAYATRQLSRLNPEHKRFDHPHEYKVGISESLMNLRNELIDVENHRINHC